MYTKITYLGPEHYRQTGTQADATKNIHNHTAFAGGKIEIKLVCAHAMKDVLQIQRLPGKALRTSKFGV